MLEERERALLQRLQLAELERDRTAVDIRPGDAWELAVAASREFHMRLRREANRLAKERAATDRALVALEGQMPAARRASAAVAAGTASGRALEQAPAKLPGGAGLPATAGMPVPRTA